jgi:hypothetical protein
MRVILVILDKSHGPKAFIDHWKHRILPSRT